MRVHTNKWRAIKDILTNPSSRVLVVGPMREERICDLILLDIIQEERVEKITNVFRDDKGRFTDDIFKAKSSLTQIWERKNA